MNWSPRLGFLKCKRVTSVTEKLCKTQTSEVRWLFGIRRKICHEYHYFPLGVKEYITQMHLSMSKRRNTL